MELIRKKFPGDTEKFSLYLGNVKLDEKNKVSEYPNLLQYKVFSFYNIIVNYSFFIRK